MRRALTIAVLAGALATPAAAGAAPVRVASGDLYALAADGSTAYAVVRNGDKDRPLALVRTTGRGAGTKKPFGERKAEFADIAASREGGVVVHWGRMASGGERWYVAEADDLDRVQDLGQGTGMGRLTLDGRQRVLAGPDYAGDAMLITASPFGTPTRRALSATGPHERHLPLDVGLTGDTPVVLDLGQTRTRSIVRVYGDRAPAAPVVSINRLQTIRGTLAVSGRMLRVAYLRSGRAYLATATATRDAAWKVRRLPGPGGGSGSASVTPGGQVLYTQRGSGGHDVYLWDGRQRRLTRTATDELEPHLAVGGNGSLFAAWTRRSWRPTGYDAIVSRIR